MDDGADADTSNLRNQHCRPWPPNKHRGVIRLNSPSPAPVPAAPLQTSRWPHKKRPSSSCPTSHTDVIAHPRQLRVHLLCVFKVNEQLPHKGAVGECEQLRADLIGPLKGSITQLG